MELIENLLQLLVTFVGALLSGISYRKSHRQAYFLLLCFYGCFALGALYWTLYLLLFDTTPRIFYVSEFGWVASVIFLRILQATLTGTDERAFRCRRAWLAPAFGVPLLAFYCTFGDILSNLIWCGMMIWLSFCAIRGLVYAKRQTDTARNMRYFHMACACVRRAAAGVLLHLRGHSLQPDLVRHDDMALLLRHPGAGLRQEADGYGAEYAVLSHRRAVLCVRGVPALDGGLLLAGYFSRKSHLLV